MSIVPDLPVWAEVIVAILVFTGASFSMIGSIGLARLATLYDRAHAPTIGSSGGVFCLSVASIITYSIMSGSLELKPGLIFLFFTLTMPVTLILLTRAALFRDRAEGNPGVPVSKTRVSPIGFQDLEEDHDT